MRPLTPILLIALAVVAGCKKNAPVLTPGLVKTELTSNSFEEFLFYDSATRLVVDSQNTIVIHYIYSSDSLVITSFANDSLTIFGIYLLNSQGQVIADNLGNQYYYNSTGENTMRINGADTTLNTWSNGDMIKQTLIQYLGPVATSTFTYTGTRDTRGFGLSFSGASSYHLLKSNSYGQTYSYTFDASGRVSTMTVSGGPSSGSTTAYTYY